MANKEEKTD